MFCCADALTVAEMIISLTIHIMKHKEKAHCIRNGTIHYT